MRKFPLYAELLLFVVILFIWDSSSAFSQEKKSNAEIYLENIGVMSSANIYLNYITLSLIKENIISQKKTGKFESYSKLSTSLNSILISLKDKVTELKTEIKFGDDDIKMLDNINNAYKLLIEDVDLLIKYLKTKSDKDYKEFEKKHDKVYNELKKMFDYEENE